MHFLHGGRGVAFGQKATMEDYLRNSSINIYSDMVHEGVHAMDYISGIKERIISSWTGEMRAYSAERKFQIAKGGHVDFANENDMMVHVWTHYKRRCQTVLFVNCI